MWLQRRPEVQVLAVNYADASTIQRPPPRAGRASWDRLSTKLPQGQQWTHHCAVNFPHGPASANPSGGLAVGHADRAAERPPLSKNVVCHYRPGNRMVAPVWRTSFPPPVIKGTLASGHFTGMPSRSCARRYLPGKTNASIAPAAWGQATRKREAKFYRCRARRTSSVARVRHPMRGD
jgi:hypothetical protein